MCFQNFTLLRQKLLISLTFFPEKEINSSNLDKTVSVIDLTSEFTSTLGLSKKLVNKNSPILVPISKFVKAKEAIREVSEDWVTELCQTFLKQPTQLYQPLVVKVVNTNDDFDAILKNPQNYNYEVLGGAHTWLACVKIVEQHPNMDFFKTRLCHIYKGLTLAEQDQVFFSFYNRFFQKVKKGFFNKKEKKKKDIVRPQFCK